MVKKILSIIIVLSLAGILGCSSTPNVTDKSSPATVRIIREAKIAKAWMMKQMEIDLATEVPIVLKLKDGDKVDGYFYLERGDNIGFNISGNSLIYASKPTDAETTRLTSDRFSFTASQEQGIAYTLTLSASASVNGEHSGATVFLEIIYPASGLLLVPIGTK